ncbi:MAG: hypothetical protein HQL49_13665 [Gammaproteobacteria bacterium]|nr:hypothetical protein [Gammaproteobacteria bacterium]
MNHHHKTNQESAMLTLHPQYVIDENQQQQAVILPIAEWRQLQQRLLQQPLSDTQQPQRRIAGLHAGVAAIANDFDAPLSDAFWSGE